MFRTYTESRGLTAPRTFTAALSEFRKESDGWFDGTIEAVDRRMARVSKLLHIAHTKAAEDPASQLEVIAELSADRTALKSLREDLTTGAASRDTGYAPPKIATTLTPGERRWVTLESAKFVADHEDARHNVAEMAERARRHAEVATSAMDRPRVLTAAFEREVATIVRMTPRPRTASKERPVFADFPDSQLFL
jgi:hypothetical protein